MTERLRELLHAYASRRSPWGPPWWIYGVAFGTANLIRQGILIGTRAQIPQAARVASWVATALVVIIVINIVAVAVQRRAGATPPGRSRTLDPIWPLSRAPFRRE